MHMSHRLEKLGRNSVRKDCDSALARPIQVQLLFKSQPVQWKSEQWAVSSKELSIINAGFHLLRRFTVKCLCESKGGPG